MSSVFKQRLSAVFAKSNQSHNSFAESIGTSVEDLNLLLLGELLPSLEQLVAIAQVTDSSADYLLGLTDSENCKIRAAVARVLLDDELANLVRQRKRLRIEFETLETSLLDEVSQKRLDHVVRKLDLLDFEIAEIAALL